MTYKRPAYEHVTIAHGGNTVKLRPSLRAACTLEASYGFPALYKALNQLNYTIISEIILSASPDRRDAVTFLEGILERPLSSFFRAVQQPIAELLTMFVPAPDTKAKRTTGTAKPLTWPEIYAALFDLSDPATKKQAFADMARLQKMRDQLDKQVRWTFPQWKVTGE